MAPKPFINYDVHHPNHEMVLTWGDTATAPIIWDEYDMPILDPEFLRERGWK